MEKATKTIETLKGIFINDNFCFTFQCAMYIAGNSNQQLRQDIAYLITGLKLPKSKCGLTAISELIANDNRQYKLM